MALMDFIKKQFIDIIQWTEDDGETMAWRFPMAEMEIQNGASLTVRESQMAVFVNEGKVADVFGPGMYKLTTQTLPVLTYLKNWDKLFESPFKSDVYFFSTRQKIDRKWGTPNPVTIRDKDFGMVRLRAFGIYAFHLTDPKAFHTTLSGTLESYSSEQLEGQLRNTIVGHIADIFGESGVPFIDMAGNQVEFGNALKAKMDPMFAGYGLALDSLNVQNISLPEELQAMLDKRIGVNMMGGMQAYTQFQTAEAIPLAAQNEGGLPGWAPGSASASAWASRSRARWQGRSIPRSPAARPLRRGTGIGRRDRRHHRKTARPGRQGHPVAGRVRSEEGGTAEEARMTY
jgi:membrane protease subunit (stomatin/prohibitin family)